MSGGGRHSGDQPVLFQKASLDYNTDNEDDFLGAGSFGSVFRCRLKETKEVVALKIINAPTRLRRGEEKSFMTEASILQHLTGCPNIVRLLGLCITPGLYALVMEYLENGDLETVLLTERDKHPVVKQWNYRINMALEIAQGMKYLHTLPKPIIHRDLKAGNVLVDKNYCCKITDFGLARMRDISMRSAPSHSRSRRSDEGTVAFTAPEVFSGEQVDEKEMKSDVYSYSIVLWQLKEMKKPYGSYSSVRSNDCFGGVRPPFSSDDCSDDFKSLIVRCWDPLPDVRLTFPEIVTMVGGIKGQTVTPITSTAPTDDDLTHLNDQVIINPDQSVPSNPDENSPFNVSREPQIDDRTVVEPISLQPSGSPSSPQPGTDQAPAHSKTDHLSSTPPHQSVSAQDLPSDPSRPVIPPSLSEPTSSTKSSTNSAVSGVSHGAGSFLDTTPLDQLPVAAGADVKRSFGAQLVVAVSVPSSNLMALEHPSRKSQDTEQALSVRETKQWTRTSDLPEGRPFLNRVAVAEEKVMVANLFELYHYDLKTGNDSWGIHKTLPQDGVRLHTLFTAHDCCCATYHKLNISDRTQGIAWYDVAHKSWQLVCHLPFHYQLQYSSAVAVGGKVYLVGDGDGAVNTVLIYDLQTGQKCGSKTLTLKRRSCASAIIDNVLYVVGGWDGLNHLRSMEALSLSNFSSITVPATPIYSCSCTEAGGALFVTGGRVGPLPQSRISNGAFKLDMSSRSWLSLPAMNVGRLHHGMSAADGLLMVVGGTRDGISGLKSVEILKL